MITLTIAFSPEGPTDIRFLGSVIRRTAEDLIANHGTTEADVLEPFPFARPKGTALSGAEKLLAIARQTHGLHCLMIHADADADTSQAAWDHRLTPGWQLIAADSTAQQQLVGLVPITMTEAWMLADTALLQEALDTNLEVVRDLGLPRPNRAEEVTHPKNELLRAIQQAQAALPPRRRQPDSELMADLYAQLDNIPLTSLRILPSFQKFEADFLAVLIQLGLARP